LAALERVIHLLVLLNNSPCRWCFGDWIHVATAGFASHAELVSSAASTAAAASAVFSQAGN
jgi:hypothetical protein